MELEVSEVETQHAETPDQSITGTAMDEIKKILFAILVKVPPTTQDDWEHARKNVEMMIPDIVHLPINNPKTERDNLRSLSKKLKLSDILFSIATNGEQEEYIHYLLNNLVFVQPYPPDIPRPTPIPQNTADRNRIVKQDTANKTRRYKQLVNGLQLHAAGATRSSSSAVESNDQKQTAQASAEKPVNSPPITKFRGVWVPGLLPLWGSEVVPKLVAISHYLTYDEVMQKRVRSLSISDLDRYREEHDVEIPVNKSAPSH